MYSILRNRPIASRPVAALLGLLLVVGCEKVPRIAPMEQLQPPLVRADPAMEVRQWDPTVATYASGGVWAWPTYQTFMPASKDPGLRATKEAFYFGINLLYSPWAAFVSDPMWKMVLYQDLTMPPTYTASPVLPPSTQPVPDLSMQN